MSIDTPHGREGSIGVIRLTQTTIVDVVYNPVLEYRCPVEPH